MRSWWTGLAPRRRPVVAALLLLVLCLAAGAVSLVAGAPDDQALPRGFSVAGPPRPGFRLPPRPEPSRTVRLPDGSTLVVPPFTFVEPGRPQSFVPVVLVPGYGGSRGALFDLAEKIRDSTGRRTYVLRLPGDGTGDLAAQAKSLQQMVVRALLDNPRAGAVDVIGYSTGGVVVRLWLADDGGASEARRVITLGSPLHGAQLAAVGAALVPDACPAACQQLVPGSSLLNRLNATPLPAGVSWLSIWTENDQTVDPPDSARLAGAVNVDAQQVCEGVTISHGGLPGDLLVTGLVLNDLGATPLAAPGPSDCRPLRSIGRAASN